MKNAIILIAILLIALTACKTHYRTLDNQAYFTDNFQDLMNRHKYYQNDSLDLTVEIPWDDMAYSSTGLDYFLPRKRQRHVFSLTKVDAKKDRILYVDSWSIIVLKKSKVDLSTFKVYDVNDTSAHYYRKIESGRPIFRKTIIDRKNKLIVTNDLIPFGKDYVSVISYDQHESKGGYTVWDIADADNIGQFGDRYKETLKIAKRTAKGIYTHNRFINVDPYERMDRFFKFGKYGNYNATVLGAPKTIQYHRKEDQRRFNEALSMYYAFSGEGHKADSLWALMTHHTNDIQFQSAGTIDDVLKRADSAQIVMFNEVQAHPEHRYLLGTLLERFYQKGFRYLGLEAFNNDSLLVEKGYPTSGNGVYVREPVLANLVRVAHGMGFLVFGYDSPYEGSKEIDQAKNIYDKTMKKDLRAKVLILAAMDHTDRNKMAGNLEHLSGAKLLTIDQSYGYLHHLNQMPKKDEVYIIQGQDLKDKPNADILLWNDLTIKDNSFSLQNAKSTRISVPDSAAENATIFCIYKQSEMTGAGKYLPIPVKVQVIRNHERSFETSLTEGDYRVLFLDDFGNVLAEKPLRI